MIKAAIDMGTNSTRLIVADFRDSGYEVLHREARITRLGQGVDQTRLLDAKAIERVVEVIKDYKEIILKFNVQLVRAAATSATRDARNTDVFVNKVREETGFEVEILTSRKEAELSFKGATHSFISSLTSHLSPLVMDIGGGSTELILGTPERITISFSKDIGCVRLTEMFVRNDPPTAREVSEIKNHIRKIYTKETVKIKEAAQFQVIGTAGTVTTLSAINLGLESYDPAVVHGSRLRKEEVRKLLDKLLAVTIEQRKQIPVMEPGRADVVVAGTIIAYELLDMLEADEMMVSEADILDGLVLSQ